MTLKEAMALRHTVRKYEDEPLRKSEAGQLNERIRLDNDAFGLSMKLVCGEEGVIGGIWKLFPAKGVCNYIILAGEPSDRLGERVGMASADLMLYAQTIGLNSWWVGGTYSRRKVQKQVGAEKLFGILVVGHGMTQGVPHRSKRPEQVSPEYLDSPGWFQEGVKASLLAPTAMNRQNYVILRRGNKVKVTYGEGILSGVDQGIVKYHFWLGAGPGNFEFEDTDPQLLDAVPKSEYLFEKFYTDPHILDKPEEVPEIEEKSNFEPGKEENSGNSGEPRIQDESETRKPSPEQG